jgi:hypothetical protein
MGFTSERFQDLWPSFEVLGWKLSQLFDNTWIVTPPSNHTKHERNHAVIYYKISLGERTIMVPDWLETEWETIQHKKTSIEKQLQR